MSVQAMSYVFDDVRGVSPVQRLVLLSIANHADKYGRNAWPSVATICEEADINRKTTVKEALRALRDAGWIEVEVNQGGDHRVPGNRRPNRYALPRMVGGPVGDTPTVLGGPDERVRGAGRRALGGPVGGYQTIQNHPTKRAAQAQSENPDRVSEAQALIRERGMCQVASEEPASPRTLEHITEIRRMRHEPKKKTA